MDNTSPGGKALLAALSERAADYIAGGFGVVPLPDRAKTPTPTGFQGAKNNFSKCASLATVRRVIANGFKAHDPDTRELTHYKVGGLALRMPDGVIGIDVDAYGSKQGAEKLAELEAKWGELPRTYYLTSRGPGGPSRILLFRATPGRVYGNPGGDIEIIQHGHRYAIAPPSIHPEGRPYVCYRSDDKAMLNTSPAVANLAQLPEVWDDGLYGLHRQESNGQLSMPAVSWLKEQGTYVSCPQMKATVQYWLGRFAAREPGKDGSVFSAHNTSRDAAYAIIRDCVAGHDGAWAALKKIREAYLREGQAKGHDERGLLAEWKRSVAGAIEDLATDGERPDDDCDEEVELPNLPPEFYGAIKALGQIRQAAHSRGRSADAVLLAVLTRMSAMAPPKLRFDVSLGPSPLTIFGVLCGDPETGKTGAKNVSMDLLPGLIHYQALDDKEFGIFADDVQLGTGQGIAEAYIGSERVMGEAGRPKTVRKKLRDHVFFYSDEGEDLAKKMETAGLEVASTIRRAHSGQALGAKNGTAETTREVPASTYSIGLLVGFQPGTIGPLLKDWKAGTPQRFLYLSATDPGIPAARRDRPVFPDALELEWPEAIVFPDAICDEVWEVNSAKGRGDLKAEPFTEHMYWMLSRVAALLAVLRWDKSGDTVFVSSEDWNLARMLWNVSCSVRDYMRACVSADAEEAEGVVRGRIAGRAVATANEMEERDSALTRAVRSAARHVQNPKLKCHGSCKRKCITNGLGSVRKKVSIDLVLERVVAAGYAKEALDGGVYGPGDVAAP